MTKEQIAMELFQGTIARWSRGAISPQTAVIELEILEVDYGRLIMKEVRRNAKGQIPMSIIGCTWHIQDAFAELMMQKLDDEEEEEEEEWA